MQVFKWQQRKTHRGERVQHWELVYRDTGEVVLEICLSNHATQKENCKIKRKIQRIYEIYFNMTYFQSFNF